jgi:transposase
MNPKPKMAKFTFKDFQKKFPDDATCLDWLCNRLYPNGIHCKKCDKFTKHHRVASRPSYSCDYCGHHVHPTADTIFHKSPTSLTTWFYAIYLMSSTRCGISAKQIERETGVTYKTAWRMFNKIREMLAEDFQVCGMRSVEADETYHGAPKKNQHANRRRDGAYKDKQPIFGIVERKGRVIARVVPDAKSETILPIIAERVLPASTVYTDQYSTYDSVRWMGKDYRHHRINHSERVYVMGHVHTQTIEGFWSLLKRGIEGVYHSVSAKWLQSYCNEYAFRYNRRYSTIPMFTWFLHQIRKNLPGGKPYVKLLQSPIQ